MFCGNFCADLSATLALNGLNALQAKSPSAQNILDAYTFEKN